MGKPVREFEPNGNTVTIQPVTCDLKTSADEWTAQRAFCIDHLAARGILFGGEDGRSAEVNLYTSTTFSHERVQSSLAPDSPILGADGTLRPPHESAA